jgi:hypothetical protein
MWQLLGFNRRAHRLALALGMTIPALFLGSCDDEDSGYVVAAVHAFYTPQELDSDAALAGTWQYEDDVKFVFTADENGTYAVAVEEDETDRQLTSHFEGHLFRLGPDSFMDLYPTSAPSGSEFYLLHFFRCHTVAKVDLSADRLEMKFVSAAWLSRQIKAGTVSTSYAKSGGVLLLTATTEEMQELLSLNASGEETFEPALEFERVRDEETQ